jgi:hypothetical protein
LAVPKILPFALVLAALVSPPALAAPANDLQQLDAYIRSCFKDIGGEPGEEITISFSVRRDGSLIGKPRITYSKLSNDQGERTRFLDNVAAHFQACLPIPVTEGLGGAIAGRMLAYHHRIPRPQTGI